MRNVWHWICRHPLAIALLLAATLTAIGAVIRQQRATDDVLREGEEALAAHDYTKARERIEKFLESRPHDTRARLLAARAARRLREYYEAGEHLKRCREDGGDAEAISIEERLIDVQRGKAAPETALRERATRGDDLALAILEVLIQFDLDTYRLHEARDELTLYLTVRPKDLQARLARAYIWERFLYFADAVEDYRKAVADHADSAVARLRLAETLLIVGTPAEALAQFQWLAERWPERAEVRLGLGRCRRRLGEADEATRVLDALLDDVPSLGEALWERGQLEIDRDRFAAAEPWLRRACAATPRDRRFNYSLYRCLLALGRDDAESFNDRVKDIDTDLLRLDQVRHAVMKQPDNAKLRHEGGLLFLRNGERAEGIRWLEMALRLDPSCDAARDALVNKAFSPDERPPAYIPEPK
jgi:tetratricopeptide (TPR) repeat protein